MESQAANICSDQSITRLLDSIVVRARSAKLGLWIT